VAKAALEGSRILVVGASSGIGRAFAVKAAKEGANTVLAARRKERLDEAVEEAGAGHVVAGDVTDPLDCERIVSEAASLVGELDILLYTVGYAPLRRLAHTTVDDWRAVLDANLVGAHQVLRAALPKLAPGAIVAVVSSESVGQPRSGLGAYVASKAALEASLGIWRTEHPRVRFSCVVVGGTVPTEFDMDLLVPSLQDWAVHGLATEDLMATDEVADVLVGLFAAALPYPGIALEHVTLRAASPVAGSAQGLISHALAE
jgi:NAD(P)-dependent dehydrogenase (short-subunit alcohol dehydrogenase family)